MQKCNRAHYQVEYRHEGKWKSTEEYLCVFHARRVSVGTRLRALEVGSRGMSRPSMLECTECQKRPERCEHDIQKAICPSVRGDCCGRDSDKELGGSW